MKKITNRILVSIFMVIICSSFVGCGSYSKTIKVKYNICSEEFSVITTKNLRIENPLHFIMPKNHGLMVITFNTANVFGFTNDMSDALSGIEFPKVYDEGAAFFNTGLLDIFDLSMEAVNVLNDGLSYAVLLYKTEDNRITNDPWATAAKQMTGYHTGCYHFTFYDKNKKVIDKKFIPVGSVTLALSENVYRIDITSYYEEGVLEYSNPTNGRVSYEDAHEINSNKVNKTDSDSFCRDIFGEYGNADCLRATDVPKANSNYYELTVEDMSPDPVGGYYSTNRFIVRVRKDATVNYLTWNSSGQEVYTRMTLDEYAQELGYKDFSKIEHVRIWLDKKTKQDKEGYITEFVDGPFD